MHITEAPFNMLTMYIFDCVYLNELNLKLIFQLSTSLSKHTNRSTHPTETQTKSRMFQQFRKYASAWNKNP